MTRDYIDRLRDDPESILYGLTRAQAERIDAFVERSTLEQQVEALRCGSWEHAANR